MQYGTLMERQYSRVIFVGENGAGKSSTINSIVDDKNKAFKVGNTLSVGESITKDIQSCEITISEFHLQLIDTPSFRNLKSNDHFRDMNKDGFHVVVLVFPIKRLTQERISFLRKVKKMFGPKLKKHILTVFTFADSLGTSSVDDFFRTGDEEFRNFITSHNKHLIFDNISNEEEVKERQKAEFSSQLLSILESVDGETISFNSSCCKCCVSKCCMWLYDIYVWFCELLDG